MRKLNIVEKDVDKSCKYDSELQVSPESYLEISKTIREIEIYFKRNL